MTDLCIQSHRLSKIYGQHKALDQVSINVYRGDIYGLIGRNGAGKTTLLKILSKQIHASEGHVEIFGKTLSIKDDPDLAMGAMIESPGLYLDQTAYANLKFKCEAMGIRRKGYIEGLLDLVDLDDVAKKKAKDFSQGMKQRLSLALALVGDPDILLLDEPTNGLDPQGIIDFRRLIMRLNQERQISIIISSHILGELEQMVDRIGVLHEGQLVKEISKEDLDQVSREKLVLVSNDLDQIIPFLEDELDIHEFVMVEANRLEIYESIDQPSRISHALIDAGLYFDLLSYENTSLEDYFIGLTGGGKYA